MNLSDSSESRIRGYLFVLSQSLRSFLPHDVATGALQEVESRIRERAAATTADPDERSALEQILNSLGSPQRLAQAYALGQSVDEALATRRLAPTLRALWHLAGTTATGFVSALGVFLGYASGAAFLMISALKLVFPQNVGLILVNGLPVALGGQFPLPAGAEVLGGYWIVPVCGIAGLAILVATHRGAVSLLAWWKSSEAVPTR